MRAQQFKGMSREDLMSFCRSTNPSWDEIDIEDWADSKVQFNLAIFDVTQTPVESTWWQETVRLIQAPLLLLTADPERGALVTEEAARLVLELGSQVRVVEISGAGHSIRREQFEPYMAAVTAFLKDHPV
jgi:pimeloyl-ACP methyl ester carboxylesterase